MQEALIRNEKAMGSMETRLEWAVAQIKGVEETRKHLEGEVTRLEKLLAEAEAGLREAEKALRSRSEELRRSQELWEDATKRGQELEERKGELERQKAQLDTLRSRPEYLLQQAPEKLRFLFGQTRVKSILVVKPYRVSSGEMDIGLERFRRVYPEAQLSLLANLDESDYVALCQDSRFADKLLYCPTRNPLTRGRLVRLCLRLWLSRWDLAVALQTEAGHAGDERARRLARLAGRQWCIFPPWQEEKESKAGVLSLRKKMAPKRKRTRKASGYLSPKFASFLAAEKEVRRGGENRYVVRISNPLEEMRRVRLTIDIYAYGNPVHPQGHYAYMSKTVMVLAAQVLQVLIEYDWEESARFTVDGHPGPPDDFWRGSVDTKQLYCLEAILCGEADRSLDRIGIFQEL